jgi:transcriptional regulator with XRE-family HTH domain
MHDGDVLQLLRKYKKISQTELAKRIYKSQETISHYEQQEHLNGKNLEQLLQALKSNKAEWNLFNKLPPPPIKIKYKNPEHHPGFFNK